jgi:hypothetical protein
MEVLKELINELEGLYENEGNDYGSACFIWGALRRTQ